MSLIRSAAVSAIGTTFKAAFREAGATALNVVPIAETAADRIKLIETLRGLLD